MKVLKQFLFYLFLIILSLLLGIVYMRIVLETPDKEVSSGFSNFFDFIYDLALFYVGSIIGSIIALCYIIFDVFYLKKKLKNNRKSIGIRFLVILIIVIIVGIVHHILEKVIDVI